MVFVLQYCLNDITENEKMSSFRTDDQQPYKQEVLTRNVFNFTRRIQTNTREPEIKQILTRTRKNTD